MNQLMVTRTDRLKADILKSARSRFLGPGFGKTTMAEIANDCGLSPAHLYNFYENKLDLAVTIMDQIMQEQENELSYELARDVPLNKALRSYFLAEFDHNFQAQFRHPGLADLINRVRQQRKVAAEGFRIRYLKDLSLFLDRGMRGGQLRASDPFWLAETLHAMTFPFRNLAFPVQNTLPEMRLQLDAVLDVMLAGIEA
ncbi:MAG: TetR/AcrR family transcriptional regulator [Pseudomonas marincola]